MDIFALIRGLPKITQIDVLTLDWHFRWRFGRLMGRIHPRDRRRTMLNRLLVFTYRENRNIIYGSICRPGWLWPGLDYILCETIDDINVICDPVDTFADQRRRNMSKNALMLDDGANNSTLITLAPSEDAAVKLAILIYFRYCKFDKRTNFPSVNDYYNMQLIAKITEPFKNSDYEISLEKIEYRFIKRIKRRKEVAYRDAVLYRVEV